MTLRAATRLGGNTDSMLREVVAAVGHDVVVDDGAEEPDLLFACGLLTVELIAAGHPYEIVAAPLFPGETEPVYRSMVVARSAELGSVMAVNEYGSWSGWHGYLADGRPEPAAVVLTGSHVASIAAVEDGDADFAAIDSSIWDDLVRQGRQPGAVHVVDRTRDYPAPPLSIRTTLPAATQEELRRGLESLPALRPASLDDYEVMRSAT